MVTVRVFARLRELAGSSRLQIDASTVGEVVAEAGRRFGPEFESAVETARIWRNGEEAGMDDPLEPGDEVALLPPVSGGAATVSTSREVAIAVPLVVAAVVVAVNLQAGDAWWAAVLVGVVGLWVMDVAAQMEARGRPVPSVGIMVGVVAGAVVSAAYGPVGAAIALGLAVMAVLGWGVAIMGYRSVDSIAPGVLIGVLATGATGSLVLTRSGASPDPQAIDVFLVVVIVSTVAGVLVDRVGEIPYLDPFTVTALTAVVVAIGAAFYWDLDVAGYLIVGLAVAVTLVAGRGLGSLLRLGAVALTDRMPGLLSTFDGAVLAGALYFPLLRLVL